VTANIIDVKNFWDSRPCNVRHSSKPVGSTEYFDEVEKKKFFVEPHIKSFSQFNLWNGKKVLEIGSRDGDDAFKLKELFGLKNEDIWVVEPNPNQIKIIETNYPNFNLTPMAIFNEETDHDFYQVIS
jgi:hypothetical protein